MPWRVNSLRPHFVVQTLFFVAAFSSSVFPAIAYAQNALALKIDTPGTVFQDCPTCPEMVVIPSGSFIMGATPEEVREVTKIGEINADQMAREGPQHKVTIAHAFAMAKFDVTFAEWDACVADGGCGGYHPDDRGWGRGNRPVINVSWNDAQAYIAWLNDKLKAATGGPGIYRLPSEAEWEYAARAGTTTSRWWTPSWWERWKGIPGSGHANCDGCFGSSRPDRTTPVGSFPPNPFGLYDMLGNVFQMTADCWNENYVGAPSDGAAWVTGDCTKFAWRGGNFWADASGLRSAYRFPDRRENRSYGAGFRVVRVIP
jgi:formylglycine-generating enzyme required for sulfatase activity